MRLDIFLYTPIKCIFPFVAYKDEKDKYNRLQLCQFVIKV